jgi:hypothetical protein
VTERLRVGADVPDVLDYLVGHPVARSMLARADEATTAAAFQALSEALQPYQTSDGVLLGSAAWLVTAQRPAE